MKSEKEIRAFRDDLQVILRASGDGDASSAMRVNRVVEALSWVLDEEPSFDRAVEVCAAIAPTFC